jgi:Pyruvate/2-oxoacid:ferredoxin oxidoreductase delta subunit
MLTERLNQVPQGAPASELLYGILKILFSEREAELVSLLPVRPFRAEKAAKIWKMDPGKARKELDRLAYRGLLLDNYEDGEQVYVLPPTMAGFFEFSMMRYRDDIDQKQLAELFYQYLNVEEDYLRALFTKSETNLGRTLVNEQSLSPELYLEVLDYEKSTEIIKTASHIGVGICYCRHKMEHVGRACDAPMDICMTFNASAESLTKHGIAREIDVSECLDLLQQARDHNLVQFGDNVREGVNFICNCCGCCCEAMLAAKRFAFASPVHTTNYIPAVDSDSCTGCGKCVEVCPVEAMSLVTAGDPHKPKKKKARLNRELCLGCGVCQRVCSQNSIAMEAREKRIITPVNSSHRVVNMAIDRGMLQNLIADTRALYSHRVMGLILGAILKMPPVKQLMASRQMKSRYLDWLFRNVDL